MSVDNGYRRLVILYGVNGFGVLWVSWVVWRLRPVDIKLASETSRSWSFPSCSTHVSVCCRWEDLQVHKQLVGMLLYRMPMLLDPCSGEKSLDDVVAGINSGMVVGNVYMARVKSSARGGCAWSCLWWVWLAVENVVVNVSME